MSPLYYVICHSFILRGDVGSKAEEPGCFSPCVGLHRRGACAMVDSCWISVPSSTATFGCKLKPRWSSHSEWYPARHSLNRGRRAWVFYSCSPASLFVVCYGPLRNVMLRCHVIPSFIINFLFSGSGVLCVALWSCFCGLCYRTLPGLV